MKASVASGGYNSKEEVKKYAQKEWVLEIAEKAIKIINDERLIKEKDTILDFGCGPGVTLWKLFEYRQAQSGQKSMSKHKRGEAMLIDSNQLMIDEVNEIPWERIYGRKVRAYALNAFETDPSVGLSLSKALRDVLDTSNVKLNVCILSLVLEYLTEDEAKCLALELFLRLEDGGVLALFEWAEHFSYDKEYQSSIKHMHGWSKDKLLDLFASLCRSIENPGRVYMEEKLIEKGMFAKKPESRLEARMGTFVCTNAHTQDTPSGDTINYLIIKRRDT